MPSCGVYLVWVCGAFPVWACGVHHVGMWSVNCVGVWSTFSGYIGGVFANGYIHSLCFV